MRPITDNNLAFLYKLTKQNKMCSLPYMNLQNKTQYRRVLDLSNSQKCIRFSTNILFEKACLGWNFSPIINRWGDWNKNILGGKKVKIIYSVVGILLGTRG